MLTVCALDLPTATVASDLGNQSTLSTHQQARLVQLKRVHAVAAKQLECQQRRPTTYAGELAMTAQQRTVKKAMQALVYQLIDGAMHHVAMRPTREQVAREAAEWQVGRHEALAMISRHIGERWVVHWVLLGIRKGGAAHNWPPTTVPCTRLISGHPNNQPLLAAY